MLAFGIGLSTKNAKGDVIETFYPSPKYKPNKDEWQQLATLCGYEGGNAVYEVPASEIPIADLQKSLLPLTVCFIQEDSAPATVADAFLRLHLISHRLIRPHGIKLDGIFGVLQNVAWTNAGPIDLTELNDKMLHARMRGEQIIVHSVDKFPQMTNYVVPKGVRIADTARVRLGAYIGEGTTIMHEGFVNFNAGALGPNMIEGRISAGVTIGANSDLGGGCSTMGTLSGGGSVVITVGENCLIGANAGTGIPLGDHCIVEAGLYITASTKVNKIDHTGNTSVVKARDLAGQSHLLYRRNSISGAVECLPTQSGIELNAELHKN